MSENREKRFLYILFRWYKLSRIKEFNSRVDKNAAWNSIRGGIDKKTVRRLNPYWAAATAAVIIGFVFSVVALLKYNAYVNDIEVLSKVGKSKAILYMNNGEKYNLEVFDGDINYNNVKLAVNSKEQLVYSHNDIDSIYYNVIDVPRGGEYRLQLADNSSVNINSASRLRFPVCFPKSIYEREVTLSSGEAFFDVEKDNERPFIVNTPNCKIKVLGTKFNVLVSRGKTTVTLEDGKVSVITGKDSEIINPGEQVIVSEDFVSKRNVDVNQYIGWTKGIFEYYDTPLSDIVNQLSLWYDVDFRFASSELGSTRFAGVILRKHSLDEALDILEKVSKVNFDIRKNYILIRK